MKFSYECSECGKIYDIEPGIYVCPECAKNQQPDKPLRGILEVKIEGTLKKNFDMFDLLPVERTYFPDIPVGNTPLWKPKRLRQHFDQKYLCIKDDTVNPTGSLKDRASYLVAAMMKKWSHRSRQDFRHVVVASTGNAASSMAGIGANAGLDVTIFVPKTAPKAKLVQALQYGARVIPVDGTYDLAFDLSLEYTKINPETVSRNTGYNPLTIEGKKTAAIEIILQLGYSPDYIFVPAGDGVILGGILKGIQDMLNLGVIENAPTVVAVQAEGSSAIHRAFTSDGIDFEEIFDSKTIADSISVDIPRNGYYALKMLRKLKGKTVAVNDNEILTAQKVLSDKAGHFAEPAASTAMAGYIKLKDNVEKNASVVILSTGSGLKDIDSAMRKINFSENVVRKISDLKK